MMEKILQMVPMMGTQESQTIPFVGTSAMCRSTTSIQSFMIFVQESSRPVNHLPSPWAKVPFCSCRVCPGSSNLPLTATRAPSERRVRQTGPPPWPKVAMGKGEKCAKEFKGSKKNASCIEGYMHVGIIAN